MKKITIILSISTFLVVSILIGMTPKDHYVPLGPETYSIETTFKSNSKSKQLSSYVTSNRFLEEVIHKANALNSEQPFNMSDIQVQTYVDKGFVSVSCHVSKFGIKSYSLAGLKHNTERFIPQCKARHKILADACIYVLNLAKKSSI